MNKFKIGDNVVLIRDNELKNGIIHNIINDMAIVRFDDILEKVLINDLALAPQVDEKREPALKTEVTITPDEFRDLVTSKALKLSNNNISLGLSFALFGAELAAELFEADND